jgi:hypothetical protein
MRRRILLSSLLYRRCSIVAALSSLLYRRHGRLRSRQNSAALRFAFTSIAPTYAAIASVVVVVARSSSRGRRRSVVAAGDYVHEKTPLRFVFRSHPSPLLTPVSGGCNVVARVVASLRRRTIKKPQANA